MRELPGEARFLADPAGWFFPSPTRSFILRAPDDDSVSLGCVFELVGQDRIDPGSSGPALARVTTDDIPELTTPWLIWSGRELGRFTPSSS